MKPSTAEKPTFVLIDQSVQKPGGHHYEYAKRILDAAENQGYTTVLLAHKSYTGSVEHQVIPAFSWTFWDNYNFYYVGRKSLRPRLGIVTKMKDIALNLKRGILFSPLGLAVWRAHKVSFKDIIFKPHLPWEFDTIETPRWLLATTAIAYRVGRIFYRRYAPIRPQLRKLIRWLILFLIGPIVALPVLFFLLRRKNPATIFAREATRALRKSGLEIGNNTLFFVPNATSAELDGLSELAKSNASFTLTHWAFLYRRPVFLGYPASYNSQMENTRQYKVEFSRLSKVLPNINVKFYTDTKELTQQYECMRIYPFKTLPVPVDLIQNRPQKKGGNLTIGYLGDARDEKGFQHLPSIVSYFLDAAPNDNKVNFLFQSNFNIPGGEPESRYARALLENYQTDRLELVEGPFDSEQYFELLERMDIVLIPYAAKNYSARSSGVLMEAFSGRRPALVPGGSWMAGMVEPSRQAYIAQLLNKLEHVFSVKSLLRSNTEQQPIAVTPVGNLVAAKITMPHAFNDYIRVSVTSLNEFEVETHFSSNIFKLENGSVTALLKKQCSSHMLLEWQFIDESRQPLTASLEVSLFDVKADIPLSAGVVTYDQPEEIIAACRDLITNFDFHRVAIDRLAEEFLYRYDPNALVAALTQDTVGANCAIES